MCPFVFQMKLFLDYTKAFKITYPLDRMDIGREDLKCTEPTTLELSANFSHTFTMFLALKSLYLERVCRKQNRMTTKYWLTALTKACLNSCLNDLRKTIMNMKLEETFSMTNNVCKLCHESRKTKCDCTYCLCTFSFHDVSQIFVWLPSTHFILTKVPMVKQVDGT